MEPMIEFITAKKYYGSHARGTVVLINGQPSHHATRKLAEDFAALIKEQEMSKQQFMNEPSDCQWLWETKLGKREDLKPPIFRSFYLFGNEDAPCRVQLFSSQDPNHDDPYREINFIGVVS